MHHSLIPVHGLYKKLSPEKINILLPIWSTTDCYINKSFHGSGKAKAFKLMMEGANVHHSPKSLGTNQHKISRYQRETPAHILLEPRFVKPECDSLDILRCEKATKKLHQENFYRPKILFSSMWFVRHNCLWYGDKQVGLAPIYLIESPGNTKVIRWIYSVS